MKSSDQSERQSGCMTKHIEELMKAAEVSKYRHFRQYNYAQVPLGEKELQKSIDAGIECVDVRNCKDNDCIYWNELHYPKFTPARQLELIKLLSTGNKCDYQFSLQKDKMFNEWEFSLCVKNGCTKFKTKDFEQGIAECVLRGITQGYIDKLAVKNILEG